MTRIIFECTNTLSLVANTERRRYQVIVNGDLVAESASLAVAQAEYVARGGVVSAPVVRVQDKMARRRERKEAGV